MKVFQVFNCSLKKQCSFTDLFLSLAQKAKERNVALGLVFPEVALMQAQKDLESFGAHVYAVKESWASISFIAALLKILKKEKPQVVDFHFCDTLNFAALFLILRVFNIRIVYHYHGEIRPIEELRFKNRHFSKLRYLSFFVDRIVCVSKANKKFLEALNIHKKINVIYNGIEVSRFVNAEIKRNFREEMGLNNGESIVTFIGSLIPRKGIDVLLRAAKDVIKDIPAARFVIVGGGDKKKYQRLAESLGINEKVFLLGFMEEYPYYILKDTDVYASASFSESFGLSIAEAQILGIPVVATSVGGVPEVLNNGITGILTPPGDSQALANKIIGVLKNDLLRQGLGKAGRSWIEENFCMQDRVNEILDLCCGMASSDSAGTGY